jgi:hypothetical protein
MCFKTKQLKASKLQRVDILELQDIQQPKYKEAPTENL